jgi:type II secretory pathway component PulK
MLVEPMRRRPPLPRALPASSERGIALLVVLLFMPIVFAIVGQLAYESEIEHRAAINVKDQAVLEYAIDGEFERALAILRYDRRQNEVDSEFDDWADKGGGTRTGGEAGLSTLIADENGKFFLGRLTAGNDAQQNRAKEIFVRILDLFREGSQEDVSLVDAQEIAEKVIRHLKREAAPGQIPHPKTNPPGTPLLLEELVFSDPKRVPGWLVDVRTKDKKVAPGLHRYLTVFGSGKVNLNTASKLVLEAHFSEPRDREFAQGIINRRNGTAEDEPAPGMTDTESEQPDAEAGNPFTDVNQVSEVEGLTMEVLQRNGIEPANDFDVKSDFFSIRVTGETDATNRLELYVVERVGAEGFRFHLHQERTDPLLAIEETP